MRINNKGFTLVELLATMAVLSAIMLIAVPNIVGVTNKNKNKTYIEDAKKFVSMAKYARAKNKSISSFSLATVDEAKDLDEGPNGSKYDRTNSVVSVSGTTYTVTLIEKKSGSCFGIRNVNESALYNDNASTNVSTWSC